MLRSISVLFLGLIAWTMASSGWIACSSDPQSCKTTQDCPTGFGCLFKVCKRQCQKDFDCRETGEKCLESYCGGRQRPDAGPSDTPPQECTPGTTENCYDGPSGTQGVGVCDKGTKTCSDEGKWGECKGQVTPGPEECNSKDDDCDGTVDEECGLSCKIGNTRPCFTGPPDTKDVGPCKAGIETCTKDPDGGKQNIWGDCVGQVLPVPERCDNKIDDNCNGKPNEGCACKPGDTQKCKADNGCAGLQSCVSSSEGTKWSKCNASKPSDEECDGLDNDCDGFIDNPKGTKKDYSLTRPCQNVCFKGTEYCVKSSRGVKWDKCDAKLPKPETCNNLDDDCDGKIDNVETKDKPLSKGCDTGKKGLCKSGERFCKAGKWGDCQDIYKPNPEDCNGLDDDCDGKVDEKEDQPCGDKANCELDTQGTPKCIPK